jgi:hypothetical protein
MSRYFGSSKPVKWLRTKLGIEKPHALGWGEWEEWEAKLRDERPVAFFFTETLPDALADAANWFMYPFEDTQNYIKNRFGSQTHVMRTGLKPGQWHEFDTRLLHAAFNELKNFVEIEQAWMQVAFDDEARKQHATPWWRRWRIWREWRCPEAGLAHLAWAKELTFDDFKDADDPTLGEPSPQALAARETEELYRWWTEVRPNRPDPWEASNLNEVYRKYAEKYGCRFPLGVTLEGTEKQEYREASDLQSELEEEYHNEDTEMLVRLVKLRRALWT